MYFQTMINREIRIPKKITPCPIVEALVEYRFQTSEPSEAILGLVYAGLKREFPKIENLPILQLPETIRTKDPNLIYQPWYKIHQGDFFIQLGPKVLSFVNVGKYLGWESYFQKISEYYKVINETGVMTSIERIGLRYINFFDFNIYEKTTVEMKINGVETENKGLNIRTVIPSDEFLTTVGIASNSELIQNGKRMSGSIIDIDVGLKPSSFAMNDILTATEKAHVKEKSIFFNLLKDDFIITLNPEY